VAQQGQSLLAEPRGGFFEGVHCGGVLGGAAEGTLGDGVFVGERLELGGTSRRSVGRSVSPLPAFPRGSEHVTPEEVLALFVGDVPPSELVADDPGKGGVVVGEVGPLRPAGKQCVSWRGRARQDLDAHVTNSAP